MMYPDFRSCLALLSLVTLLAIASGCGGKKPPAAAVQTVQAGFVEEIEPDAAERYSATILPNLQVNLAFKSPGLIEEVYQVRGADGRRRDVEPGDKVAEGTHLASVRPIDYQQKVEQGEAGVRQAQARLEQAKAAFTNAGLNYTRANNLYSSASLIKPDFDQAQAQYDSTQAQVQAAQAVVESARTQADQAKTSLKDTVLQAPFSGFVIARNVSKGSLVGNSTVGFSIIDTHVVKAEFAIPDTSLRGVRLGQRLLMNLDAMPNAVAGIVTAISPQADPKSRVFSVELTIANANSAIRPGMIGSLGLAGAAHPASRLVIPLSAVVRAPANPQAFGVFRIETRDGKSYAVAQPIQIGNTYGNAIEVTSGVSKRERIVALGGELLQSEQEIRVLQ
jgi:RND family efflux transporter MFP subunit